MMLFIFDFAMPFSLKGRCVLYVVLLDSKVILLVYNNTFNKYNYKGDIQDY